MSSRKLAEAGGGNAVNPPATVTPRWHPAASPANVLCHSLGSRDDADVAFLAVSRSRDARVRGMLGRGVSADATTESIMIHARVSLRRGAGSANA